MKSFTDCSSFKRSIRCIINFLNTSKRRGILFNIQEENEEKVLHLISPISIRWTSFYNSVERVLSRYSSIVQALNRIHKDDGDPGAKGFELYLKEYHTVKTLTIVKDLFSKLNILELYLQRADLSINNAFEMIHTTTEQIKTSFTTGLETETLKLATEFETSRTFQGIGLTDIPDRENFNIEQDITSTIASYKDVLL